MTPGKNDVEIYRCTECGKLSVSEGWLHAHAERHRGVFGIQWPWNVGDADELRSMTETIHVTDYEVEQHA